MKSRHPSNFGKKPTLESIEDLEEEDSEEDVSSDLELWKLLPQLKDLPESLLKKLPMSAMFQLNTALSKEKKTTEKLGVNTKLTHNVKQLAKNPVVLERGRDNRREVLHPPRFLGGACSSLADQWAEARRSIGEAGVTALGNYDLDAVGCGGCVTPKGWLEIHNPASQELKLKLFHMPNMEFSVGKDDKALGIAAQNEWPVILCLSSVKSMNNFARTSLIFLLVRFLPDGKEKTGLLPITIPFFSFNLFNRNIAAAGHFLSPLILNTSTTFPLKPVVLV